ncbi:L,D-transpeptidase family protein [Nitratifractor salsuginis]|nr:L,D-transpeptidase family protein [Nitratifractor salsuginis]
MKKIVVSVAFALIGVQGAQAGKRIVVDLTHQQACAYQDGDRLFCGDISTGKPGHRTPSGHFRVLEKELRHVSSRYPEPHGGARMDYMLRLTNYGVAMHLGYVPNYPASHGCIRMENGFAQRMFAWANVGTPVVVRGTPPRYVDRPGPRRVARRAVSRKSRTVGNFEGNRPLKFLSSVPGKRESLVSKRDKKELRHSKKKKEVITENRKPMTPLGMLKS